MIKNPCEDICVPLAEVKRDMEALQNSDHAQWREIRPMKTYLIAALTTFCLTLIGVIINIVLTATRIKP